MRLARVMVLICLNGVFQSLGVVSIFPFFALASSPELFRRSQTGAWILERMPQMSDNQLLASAGSLALFMILVSNISNIGSEMVRSRYANSFATWLGCLAAEEVAARPYSYFLQQNSTLILKKLLTDVTAFIHSVFLPLGEALSRTVALALLAFSVFLTQPGVALGAMLGLGIYYYLVLLWFQPKAREIGSGLNTHYQGQLIAVQHLLSGIKPILVHDKAGYFIGQFRFHSTRLASLNFWIQLYSAGPRYLIEPLAFGGLVAIVVFMAWKGQPFSDILPHLAVIGLAAYRILPSLQVVFTLFSEIATYSYTLREVESITPKTRSLGHRRSFSVLIPELRFEHDIKLENVTFRYESPPKTVLEGINLAIPKNTSLGIVGTTGCGKSTFADLLLGLHRPNSGRILLDGRELTEELLTAWRRLIGYVPQDIYLMDASIGENIAFGIGADEVDFERLREVAHAAQILQLIEHDLPKNFKTEVGERGVRLSGGQRQRVGLARALYHRPEILILDEATSALDTETEAAVMQTIRSLQGSLTIITIAHRVSTLVNCDLVIRLQGKKIVHIDKMSVKRRKVRSDRES